MVRHSIVARVCGKAVASGPHFQSALFDELHCERTCRKPGMKPISRAGGGGLEEIRRQLDWKRFRYCAAQGNAAGESREEISYQLD